MTHEEQFPNCPFCIPVNGGTPVIDDEENCHCGPCTAMNEPLTLEGDIRYLKAHIETKNRQLAEKDAALLDTAARLTVYRTVIDDYSAQNRALREENERLNSHKARYQEEILALEGTIEDYAGVVQRLRNIFRVAHDAVELFVKG